MRIKSLTAFQLPVQLRKPVKHASHQRSHNETLIVRCELDTGQIGWGEGLPRTYVTGESIDSAWRQLEQTDFAPLIDCRLNSTSDLVRELDHFVLADAAADDGVHKRECFGNSVRCALELSLLDAMCQSLEQSVGDFLYDLPDSRTIRHKLDEVRYSGVVTAGGFRHQLRSALKMRLFGFSQVKVKVGANGVDDVRSLKTIRRMLRNHVDLRLDANEAWRAEDVVRQMKSLLPFRISSLEQPVPHAEVAHLADIRKELPVPVMLDESLCCREDADSAIAHQTCDLFNLRISKCGGLVNCMRLAAQAAGSGIGYQLGCQVGETGILSAAGRHFAGNISGLRFLEGSYDRFLVQNAFTAEDLTFGYGGRAARLTGFGLGICVDERGIRQRSTKTRVLVSV